MDQAHDDTMPTDAAQVLDFWFADALALGWPRESRSALWFGGGKAQDDDITRRFEASVERALEGGLTDWESAPRSRLALVILLDQFPRNIYRGQAKAFAGDNRAQTLVRDALERSWDSLLPLPGTIFLYMPLMHAENLALQELCVRKFEALVAAATPERQKDLQGNLAAARQHHDIIARFGRFPYRNAALGRASSEDEARFLRDGPRFGQ